jgi:hypothetical protein
MCADKKNQPKGAPRKEFPNAVDVLKLPGVGKFAKTTPGGSLETVIEQSEKLAVKRAQLAQVDRLTEEERAVAARLKQQTDEMERGKKTPDGNKSEKYSVDQSTGSIRVATADEPNALNMGEAEVLSAKIKADIEARKKADRDTKEGPFVLAPDGSLQVKEGASMTGQDVAVLQAVTRAQEGGDRRSAMDILKEKREEFLTLQEWTGGGNKRGDIIDDLERLAKIKELLGMDAATKELLAGIRDKLDNLGKGAGENEQVKDLREQITKLNESIQQKEKEALETQIRGLNQQLLTMEARLEKKLADTETKDEYSIMHTGLKGALEELKGIRGDLVAILKQPPPALSPEQKKTITKGISEDAKREASLQALEEQTFFG